MNTNSSKKILEIYNNSTEFKKLVFMEVLVDLLKPIENKGKSLMSAEMVIMEDMISNFQKELESIPEEILINLINNINGSFPKANEGEDIVPFAYNKAKIHFGTDLRNELVSIGNEEINEIHIYRKLFILNLEKLGLIEKYSLIKDSFLDKLIKEYKEEITIKNDEGVITGIDQNSIDLEIGKEFDKLSALFGKDKLEEAIKEVLELDFSLFVLKKESIIELVESITGKKQDLEKTKFDYQSGILLYKGEEFHFKKGATPVTLLNQIFQSDNNGLKLYDAHRYINQEHILNNNDYYRGGKETIESIIKGINRRIREKFPKDKFLEIKEGSIRIVK